MIDIDSAATVSEPIPTAPGAWPLLGHLPYLVRRPLGFFTALPTYGDLVTVRVGRATVIVVCEPALVRHVLRHDEIFDKGGFFFDRLREVMGEGLASVTRSSGHRAQRRLCQPAFHAARMPGYGHAMTACAVAVIDTWHDGQILNVFDETAAISSRILAVTMFSDTLTSTVRRQAIDDVAATIAGLYRRMLTPPSLDWLPTPGNHRYRRANARLHRTMSNLIADRRNSDVYREDLLSALLAARDTENDGRGLSDTEIIDLVRTFFFAGTETTAKTLAWALGLLAHHPEVEQRLHGEVDTVLAGRPAEHADLPRLELTRRVVAETLRLWPPGWILTRRVTADTRLGGYPVAEGTTVVYSPYLIHRRPDLYDNPERFDPDRWLPGRTTPKDGYIPFGGGARTCIGEQFGTIEAVLALATIVSRWRLQALPGHSLKPAPAGTLGPRGLRLSATHRTPKAGDRHDPDVRDS
ncbi:cytochrome P450 [Nocardia thraciensis]